MVRRTSGGWEALSLSLIHIYYLKVRTYKIVSGEKYYSAWSGAKSVKVIK